MTKRTSNGKGENVRIIFSNEMHKSRLTSRAKSGLNPPSRSDFTRRNRHRCSSISWTNIKVYVSAISWRLVASNWVSNGKIVEHSVTQSMKFFLSIFWVSQQRRLLVKSWISMLPWSPMIWMSYNSLLWSWRSWKMRWMTEILHQSGQQLRKIKTKTRTDFSNQ